MKNAGWLLLILGVGSFILPFFGLEFRLMRLFGDATPIAAIVMAIVGIGLLVMSGGKAKPAK